MPFTGRTIRKWRQRAQKKGRAGLESQMGRPKTGALGSYKAEIREAIRRWRQVNPGWGPTTLSKELALYEGFRSWKLPSRSAIARFLNEEGLIASKAQAIPLPKSEQVRANTVHQVWEMDARGHEQIANVGMVTLINLNDRYSHTRLLCYPCLLGEKRVERHAQTEDYQAALRMAFMEWGLPTILQTDHDSVFYDNRSPSPFPTRLHLWLIALGITFTFIEYNQPTQQGMTERSHQLWHRQVIQGHSFADWNTLFDALLKRRTFLNCHLPCSSIGHLPPLEAFPSAIHSGRHYALNLEAEMLSLQRVYAYLASGRWFRFVSKNGTISLGGHTYYLGTQWHKQQAEISFLPEQQRLRFLDDAGRLITDKPIQGLSPDSLMGDLFDLSRFPAFQLPLPFSSAQQQMARLYETIS
jgi:transposase